MARLWVLRASRSQRREVDQLLASFHVRSKWFPQRNTPNHFQVISEISGKLAPLAPLASSLSKIGVVFEIEDDSERYLHHPGLGIHRQALDEAGEIIIRAEQLALQLRLSGGNLKEFERRFRMLQGTAWLDLLEPYRLELLRYDEMPRAV